jgi:hypothetical protein
LGSWHNDFPSVYHNKLYFDRLYLAPVMERWRRWRAFI